MRQSQKTEQKADHLKMISLENRKQSEARSTASGENTIKNGISFKERVLSRDNLNLAYKKVYKNKGAAGIDGMTVYELFDYIKENKSQLIESISDLSYKPSPVKRVEIPKPDGTKRKLGVPTVVDRLYLRRYSLIIALVLDQIEVRTMP